MYNLLICSGVCVIYFFAFYLKDNDFNECKEKNPFIHNVHKNQQNFREPIVS